MKIKLNFDIITRKYNSLRMDCQNQVFNKNYLIALLTGVFGIRIDSVFFRTLKENNIILTTDTDSFKFPKDPVYKEKLQHAYESAVDIRRKYNKKYYKSKEETKTSSTKADYIEISQEETINTAISILKEAGYKIYKPVTSFEEV